MSKNNGDEVGRLASSEPAKMPSPKSVTHVHLLAIINTLLEHTAPNSTVCLLDLGCGGGDLMAYLHNGLRLLRPDLECQIYGYDVFWGSSETNAAKLQTVRKLQLEAPGPNWSERVSVQPTTLAWPYPDGFFQVIVSNQVFEHVRDHAAVLGEVKRTLAPGGSSAHLFPLKNYVYEGHTFIPFAHRFKNHDLAVAFLRMMHRLGFGKLDSEGKRSSDGVADAENQADWFMRFTNYRSTTEFLNLGRSAGLRVSFRFTQEFYWAKVRSLLRRPARYRYAENRSALVDWWWFGVLKYVSGITLLVSKPHTAEDAELLFAPSSATTPASPDIRIEARVQ